MKTIGSSLWKWCAGLSLALGLCIAAPQMAAGAYSGEGTFTKITSLADLTEGYYVIARSNGTPAMKNVNAGTFFVTNTISPVADTLTDPDASIVWLIETNATYGGLTLFNEASNKYVSYSGTANAAYAVDAVNGTTGVWKFSYASGVFAAANVAASARVLQYNVSTPRFAVYSSSQAKFALYKMEENGASAPAVTTVAASGIGAMAATANGDVTDDGGDTVTERGVCYKTSAGVAITDNPTAAAAGGTGAFSVDLSSLSVNQIYYFKAYAINGVDTTLAANELNFTTLANVPAAPTVDNPTASTLDIAINENGNPAATEFAIQRTSDDQYLQADGSFGASAVWQTAAVWGTKTATGLSAATEYFFQVKARNGASVETAFGSTASGTTAAAPTGIWINPLSAGAPMGSYYLGDTLGDWYVNFEIGQASWDYAQIGLGTSAAGTDYNWGVANWYEDGEGSNKRVRRNLSGTQFTATGSHYVICQARENSEDAFTSKSGNGWGNSAAYPPVDLSSAYFTVNELTAASDVTVARDGTYPATRVDLGWTRWNDRNVLITVATATPSGSPVNGTTYSANDTFGNQTVVSGSQAGTALEVTGLIPGQTYYFTFYSENYSYYSAGETAASVATALPQARNTSGGSPEAPATLFLGDTGQTFGFDSWGTVGANYGAARLWVRHNNADLTGGTASDWSEFVNDEHKTRTFGLFNQTGTWYWGLQMDYGAEYGTAFWYKAGSADWADLSANGAGASLTVTVSAINDAADPSAVLDAAEIDLSWSKNAQGNNVLVVRKTSAQSWTEPTPGTSYSAGNSLGAGVVVYNGSDTSASSASLAAGTTYDFKFYSVNNDYYAAGVTSAPVSTLACEPDAPTGLYASATNASSFTAAWDATDRATGYRLDVSESATFSGEETAEPIFTETMGTVVSTTTLLAHETANGFDNDAYTMSNAGVASTGDVRVTSASAGYTGASGAANIWFPSTAGSYGFGIAGIDASGYDSLQLSFGYRKESGSANATFAVEWSTDGSAWTPVTVSGLPAEGAATGWYLISSLELPSGAVSAALQLRWVKSGSVAMRLDDVKLEGVTAAAVFVDGYENLAVAGTSQLVEGLSQNTAYYFRVRAEGEGGCPSANSATAEVTTPMGIQDQTIDFPAIGDKVISDVVELSATASSGLPVSFAVLSGPAEIDEEDGVTLTFSGLGEVSIVASQAGNGSYNPAPSVTNTFTVTKAIATVTLNSLAQAYDGTARIVTATTDPEGLTVDITYDGSATAPVDPGSYEVVGTVVDGTYQGSDTGTLEVSVADPASFSATAAGVSAIDLAFAANAAGNDVVIVANGTGSFSAPSGAPVLGGSLGGGTVVYIGTSSPQTLSSLSSCTPYFYKAWSQIDGFYSVGLTDDAATAAPAAPTGLDAVADYTSFTASWEAAAGASGYRLDVSTSETFSTGGGADSVYAVDFEDGTKNSYAVGNVTLNGISWNFNEAMIGDLANDRKNGLKSARLRSNETVNASGIISMNEDLSTGLSSITLLYAKYGADADMTGRVDYSTNGGADWTSAGTFTANSTTLTQFEATNLNVTGTVRVRVVKTSGTGSSSRLNIDDINLHPYDSSTSSFLPGYENLAVEGTSQLVEGLEEGSPYYFRVRAEGDGGCASDISLTASATTRLHLRAVLGQTAVNVREAGEGRFFVRLNQAPEADVAVNVSRSAGDAGLTVQSGASLTFSAANWSAWQAVTLAAAADGNADNEEATFAVSVAGVEDQLVTATALDDDIGDNLALASGGSLVSGTRATKPEWLIDGEHLSNVNYGYTVWTNLSSPGTITLDLRAAAVVSRIRLLNWDWGYRTHQYRIESSLNGVDWSGLVDASAGEHRGWEDWDAADRTARYLRFTGLSSSANQYVALAELEVYGTRDLSGLPQLQVSRSTVNVREAGEGRFYVRLDRAPEVNIPVSVARSSGDESLTVQSGAALTFGPTTWATWQLVTLAAAEDGNAVGETATIRVSAPGALDQSVTATALDDDIGDNLALASAGSTISGTRNASTKPEYLIDGVHASSANYGYTHWTNIPSGAITLDLKAATTVSRIRLLNWDWTYRTHQYRIEASLNGSSWTTVVDADASEQRGWEEWTVDNEPARYLRFTGVTNSANPYVCVAELEVYGAAVPLPQAEVSTDNVNVREAGEGRFYVRLDREPLGNVTVGVSFFSGDAGLSVKSGATRTFTPANWSTWQVVTLQAGADANADNETATFRLAGTGLQTGYLDATALDDDIGTNWALASNGATIAGTKNTTTKPEWLIDGAHLSSANYGYTFWTNDPPGAMTLDLQEATTVSRIRLLNWDWGYRTHQYRIESSLDGAEWTTVVDAGTSKQRGWEDWAVAGESIRYLRFTGVSNSANRFVCIAEWEVYGERTAGRRSLAPAKGGSAAVESEPTTVVTSDDVAPDYESGWAAVDGDPETAWVGQKVGGGYILVGYEPTLRLKTLEVDLAEGSLTGIQCLYSLDAQDWQPLPEDLEANPVSLNFLWLIFPDDGTEAVPEVFEIRPNL
ncbi:MAG: hypothetical protein EOM72_00010 [Opitutae bacterium]|nr:hypothetical protein [Opitutae bacterium]